MPNPVLQEETQATTGAVINTASSGDQTIVAAVPGKQIVVTNYVLVNTTAQSLTWKSGSTALSGPMALGALATLVVDNDAPVLVCNVGEALVLNLGAATQVSGHLTYFVAG